MKYTFIDSLTLFEVFDFIDTLDIDAHTKERYEAALTSESLRHEMLKGEFNSHPTNFTKKDIDEIDNIIIEFMSAKWKPELGNLNCKFMVQNLYRQSDEVCYYFPTTYGIRRNIKLYIFFGDKESLNRFKLTNPELYNDMELIGT